MLKVNAELFVEATQYLITLRGIAENVTRSQQTTGKVRPLSVSERVSSGVDAKLIELRTQCEALDMRLTIKHINRCLNKDQLSAEAIIEYSVEIYTRFRDELAERLFYSIPGDRAELYEKPLKGWETVIERFGCSFYVVVFKKYLKLKYRRFCHFH